MEISQRGVYNWTSDVLFALRKALDDQGFSEILPAILSERYEPGARHSIAVLGDHALPNVSMRRNDDGRQEVSVTGAQFYYLPVSHCVEKQFALEHTDRVYCMAPCLRLLMEGEEHTGRHLYTFFQVEVEWRTERVEDVYEETETILKDFAGELSGRLERTGRLDAKVQERLRVLADIPYERLPFLSARARVVEVGGAPNPHAAGDLTHAEEKALSEASTRPFWLTDYPDGVRDSLYRRSASGLFATYDLILPYGLGEVATGGLRPDSSDEIKAQALRLGKGFHPLYASWKARTSVQSGGLGFGLERLIRYCSCASSVLDLRFAHDQGPNRHIGEGIR